MNISGVPKQDIVAICKFLGIELQIKSIEKDGDINLRIWPKVGSDKWRQQSLAGRHRQGLCFHVQHFFMASLFAAHPDAIIATWYTKWNYTLFNAGAVPWTRNEIAARHASVTCACTQETINLCLVTPDEIQEDTRQMLQGIKILRKINEQASTGKRANKGQKRARAISARRD